MKIEENKNPWTLKSTRQIYENPWINLQEDQVVRPNNTDGIYGYVHFKNKAVGIVPIDDQHNTWLVGQYRYTLREYSWEIPTGGVPYQENTLEGAKRELREETGLLAGKWTELLKIHLSNSVTDEVGFVFIARDLSQGPMDWDDTEILKIRKVPFREALDMVMKNEVTDSLSISGILKTANVLGI